MKSGREIGFREFSKAMTPPPSLPVPHPAHPHLLPQRPSLFSTGGFVVIKPGKDWPAAANI